MRIERIHISGFGCLTDRTYEFPEGRAVLVLEDNESGKSTLTSAILACICGLPTRKQAGEKIKMLDVYRPWQGEAYGVEMDMEAGGHRYRIERDFARGTFAVRDLHTNKDITARCQSDLSNHFLHLPREDFSRIAFMSGKELHNFASTANIRARLSALVEGSQDQSGGDLAIAALQSSSYTFKGRTIKVDTAISRLSSEISEKESALRDLEAGMGAASEDTAALDQARNRQAELVQALAHLDIEYRAARLQEVRARITAARSIATDAESLAGELKDLEAYAAFPAERKGQLDTAIARAGERNQRIADLREQAGALQRQADELAHRTGSVQLLAGGRESDLDELLACEVSIRNALEACNRNREAAEAEKRALRAEGIDTESISDLWQRFESMPAPDREFLRNSRERELEANSIIREAEAEADKCAACLDAINKERSTLSATGKALLAAGSVCGTAAVALMILRIIGIGASVAIAAAGSVVMMVGFARLSKAGGLKADEKAGLERASEDAARKLKDASSQMESDDVRLHSIARTAGYENPALLLQAFRECERVAGRLNSLNSLAAKLAQAEDALQSANADAARVLRRHGVNAETPDLPAALKRTRDTLSALLDDRRRLAHAEQDIAALNREITKTQESAGAEIDIARAILEDAEIDRSLPIDEALKEFAQKERHYRRYREIKDSLLPAASKHLAPDESLDALLAEERELLETGEPNVTSAKTPGEVEAQRAGIRASLDTVAAELHESERRVGACVDAYRTSYPVLAGELAGLRRELARASRFGDAVATAAEVLREVSDASRRRWATALNSRATAILPHLNSDYDTLRFDDTLAFTIRHIEENRIIDKETVDACLSTGAKDQIYLAVRLACCGELSETSEPLPIILDDPLMAADDARFASSMQYVMSELVCKHQVIILSCHRSRHSQLFQEAWFAGSAIVVSL